MTDRKRKRENTNDDDDDDDKQTPIEFNKKKKHDHPTYLVLTSSLPSMKILKSYELNKDSWIDSGLLPRELMKNFTFSDLWELHPEEKGKVKMRGKIISTPRWQKSYGKNYNFTGLNHVADPIPLILQSLLIWINNLSKYTDESNSKFNQILLNWYENGHHYIGAHSDDERQLYPHSPIISISLGATRLFRIRKKIKGSKERPIIKNIPLINRKVLIMGGKMQEDFTHEIVKVGGKKGERIGRRINITFRQFI